MRARPPTDRPARGRVAAPRPGGDRTAVVALALVAASTVALLPGGFSRFVLPKLAVLAVALAVTAWARPGGRLPRAVAVTVGAGAVWLVVAALAGDAPAAQLVGRWPRYEGLVALPLYVGALVAGARLLGPDAPVTRTRAWRAALTVVAVTTAVVSVLEQAGLRPLGGAAARPGALIGNASQQGAFGAMVLAALLPAVVARAGRWPLVGAVAAAVVVVVSGSRAALLAAVAGAVVVALLARVGGHGRRTLVVPGAAVAAVTLGALVLPGVRDRVTGADELAAGSVGGRLLLWRDSLALVRSHLLTGVGPSGFLDAHPGAASEEWRRTFGTVDPPDSAHSVLLQPLTAGGVVLGLLTVVLVVVVALTARRSAALRTDRRATATWHGSAAGVAAGGTALLTGFTHAATTPLLLVLVGALVATTPRAPGSPARAAGAVRAVAGVGAGLLAAVLALACVGDVHLARGVDAAIGGDSTRADRDLRTAARLRPWDPDVPVLATQAFTPGALAGDTASAERALAWSADALRRVPTSTDATFGRAVALGTLGSPPDALATVEPLLAADPANAALLLAAGTWAAQSGDLARGLDLLERAVDIDPDERTAWLNLAAVAAAAGDGDAERRARERLAQLDDGTTSGDAPGGP